MDADEAGFLVRVREAPADDAPRLIFADWLDDEADPRGRFIRVQVALARMPPHDPRRPKLARDEAELLARHAAGWAAPFRGLATGPVFRRGFVEEVKITARQFVAHAADLFAAGPVRHVHLLDIGSHLAAVLASPALGRLTGLTVYAQHFGEPLARAVAGCSHLANLSALELGRNGIGDGGAEALAASPFLGKLERLDLGENGIGERGARALAGSARLGGLRALELAGNAVGPGGAGAIAGSDRLPALGRLGLAGNRVGAPRLRQVARPGVLLRVGGLDLSANGITPDGVDLLFGPDGGPPGVRDLDLGDNELGDGGVARLAGSPRAAGLWSLRLAGAGVGDAGLTALARSPHLPRLASLDLLNNPVGDAGFYELLASDRLPALRRVVPPQLGLSFRVRLELHNRFERG